MAKKPIKKLIEEEDDLPLDDELSKQKDEDEYDTDVSIEDDDFIVLDDIDDDIDDDFDDDEEY